ncbi:unnamed protein product [Pleuronectes platessa]|uniref:Uncharacterized protein n=1 Tax=Pleuronectes platessa TaxID=8262 RepID=A0A9N7V4U2_PLEPL|nr:unnamed protein product [Pleuronectes platessa]
MSRLHQTGPSDKDEREQLHQVYQTGQLELSYKTLEAQGGATFGKGVGPEKHRGCGLRWLKGSTANGQAGGTVFVVPDVCVDVVRP